jgi:hypothetical protein
MGKIINETCKNLISFIKEHNPEMHYNERGQKVLEMCIGKYKSDDFLDIIDNIEDGGYNLIWYGDYFYIELNDFLRNECDFPEIDDFVWLISDHIK